jgi:uncharacterized membrane protein YccC
VIALDNPTTRRSWRLDLILGSVGVVGSVVLIIISLSQGWLLRALFFTVLVLLGAVTMLVRGVRDRRLRRDGSS